MYGTGVLASPTTTIPSISFSSGAVMHRTNVYNGNVSKQNVFYSLKAIELGCGTTLQQQVEEFETIRPCLYRRRTYYVEYRESLLVLRSIRVPLRFMLYSFPFYSLGPYTRKWSRRKLIKLIHRTALLRVERRVSITACTLRD